MADVLEKLTKPLKAVANKMVETVKKELDIQYEPEDESLTANVKGLVKQATENVKRNVKKKVNEYKKEHQEDVVPEPTPEPKPIQTEIMQTEPIQTQPSNTVTKTLFASTTNDPDIIKHNEDYVTELEYKETKKNENFINSLEPLKTYEISKSDGTTETVVYDPKNDITGHWYQLGRRESNLSEIFRDPNTNKVDESTYTQFLQELASTKKGDMKKEDFSQKYASIFDRMNLTYDEYVKKYPSTSFTKEQYNSIQRQASNNINTNPYAGMTAKTKEEREKLQHLEKITLDDVLEKYDKGDLDYDYQKRDMDKEGHRAIHSKEDMINLLKDTDSDTINNVYAIVAAKAPHKDQERLVQDTTNVFQTVANNLNAQQDLSYYNEYVGIQNLLSLNGEDDAYKNISELFTNKINDIISYTTDVYYNPALSDEEKSKYKNLGSLTYDELKEFYATHKLSDEERGLVGKLAKMLYYEQFIQDKVAGDSISLGSSKPLSSVIEYANIFIKGDDNWFENAYSSIGERLKTVYDSTVDVLGRGMDLITGETDHDVTSSSMKSSIGSSVVEARTPSGKYGNDLMDTITGEKDATIGDYNIKYTSQRRNRMDMVGMFGREIITDPLTLATIPLGGEGLAAKGFQLLAKAAKLDKLVTKASKVLVGIDKVSKETKLINNWVANAGKTWLGGMFKWALDEVGLDLIMAAAQKTEYNNTDLSIDIATGLASGLIKTREIRSFLNGMRTRGVDDSLIRMYLKSKGKSETEIDAIMTSMTTDTKVTLGEQIRKDLISLGDNLPKGELKQNVFEDLLNHMDESAANKIKSTQSSAQSTTQSITKQSLSKTLISKTYDDIERTTQQLLNNTEESAKQLLANNGSKLVKFSKNKDGGEDLIWNPSIKNARTKGLNQYISGSLNHNLSYGKIVKNRMSRGSKVAHDVVVSNFGKEYKNLSLMDKLFFKSRITKKFNSKKEIIKKILDDGRIEFFTFLHLTGHPVSSMSGKQLKRAYSQYVNDSKNTIVTEGSSKEKKEFKENITKADQLIALLTGNRKKFGETRLPHDVFKALCESLGELSPAETLRVLESIRKSNVEFAADERVIKINPNEVPSIVFKKLIKNKKFATINHINYSIKRVDKDTIKLIPTDKSIKGNVLYVDLSNKNITIKDKSGKIIEVNDMILITKKPSTTGYFYVSSDNAKEFLGMFGKEISDEELSTILSTHANSEGYIDAITLLDASGVLNNLKSNSYGNRLIEFVLRDKANGLGNDWYELHSLLKDINEEFNAINAFEKKFSTNSLSYDEVHNLYVDAANYTNVPKEIYAGLKLDSKSLIDRMAALNYVQNGTTLKTSNENTKIIATARQKRLLETLFGKDMARNILKNSKGFTILDSLKKAQKAMGLSDDELIFEIQKGNAGFIKDIITQFHDLDLDVNKQYMKAYEEYNSILSQIINRIPEDREWKALPSSQTTVIKWLNDIREKNNMGKTPNKELNELISEAICYNKSYDFKTFEDKLVQEMFKGNYSNIFRNPDGTANNHIQDIILQKVRGEGWVGIKDHINDLFQKRFAANVYVWNDGNIEVLKGELLKDDIEQLSKSIQEKIDSGARFGGYYDSSRQAIVYIGGEATYTDINHEWFHSSLDLCFTAEEVLENKKLFLDVFDKHREEIMGNATQRGYIEQAQGMTEEEAKLFFTEEWLAERYGEWATGKMITKLDSATKKELGLKQGYGWENILGAKVINFFKRLWVRMQLLFHLEIRKQVMNLFEKVYNRTDIVKQEAIKSLPDGIKPNTLEKYSMSYYDQNTLDKLTSEQGYTDKYGTKYILLDGKIYSSKSTSDIEPNRIFNRGSSMFSISGRNYSADDVEQYRKVKLSNGQEISYYDLLSSMVGESIDGLASQIEKTLKREVNGTIPKRFTTTYVNKGDPITLEFNLIQNNKYGIDYAVTESGKGGKGYQLTIEKKIKGAKRYISDSTFASVSNMASLSYFTGKHNKFFNYVTEIPLLAEARYKSLFYPIDNKYKKELLKHSNYNHDLEAINELETLNRFNSLIPSGAGDTSILQVFTQGFKEYRNEKIVDIIKNTNIPFTYYINPNTGLLNIQFELTDNNGVSNYIGFHVQSKNLNSNEVRKYLGRGTQVFSPMITSYQRPKFGTILTNSDINQKNIQRVVNTNFTESVDNVIKQTGVDPNAIRKYSLSKLPSDPNEKKFLQDYYKSLLGKNASDQELKDNLTFYKTLDDTYLLRADNMPFAIYNFTDLNTVKTLVQYGYAFKSSYSITDKVSSVFGDVGLFFSTKNNKELFNRMTVKYGDIWSPTYINHVFVVMASDIGNRIFKDNGMDVKKYGEFNASDREKFSGLIHDEVKKICDKYFQTGSSSLPDTVELYTKIIEDVLIRGDFTQSTADRKLLKSFRPNAYLSEIPLYTGKNRKEQISQYLTNFYKDKEKSLGAIGGDAEELDLIDIGRFISGIDFSGGHVIPTQGRHNKDIQTVQEKYFPGNDSFQQSIENIIKDLSQTYTDYPVFEKIISKNKIEGGKVVNKRNYNWDELYKTIKSFPTVDSSFIKAFDNLSPQDKQQFFMDLYDVYEGESLTYGSLFAEGWTTDMQLKDVKFISFKVHGLENIASEFNRISPDKNTVYYAVPNEWKSSNMQEFLDSHPDTDKHRIYIISHKFATEELPHVNYSLSKTDNLLLDGTTVDDDISNLAFGKSTELEEKAMNLKAISGVSTKSLADIDLENMVNGMVKLKGIPNDAFTKYSLSKMPEDSGLRDYLYRYYKSVHGEEALNDEAIKEDMTIYKTKDPNMFLLRSAKEPFVISHESTSPYWLDDLIEHGYSFNASVAVARNVENVGRKFGGINKDNTTYIGYFTSKDHGGLQDQSLLERLYLYGDDAYTLTYDNILSKAVEADLNKLLQSNSLYNEIIDIKEKRFYNLFDKKYDDNQIKEMMRRQRELSKKVIEEVIKPWADNIYPGAIDDITHTELFQDAGIILPSDLDGRILAPLFENDNFISAFKNKPGEEIYNNMKDIFSYEGVTDSEFLDELGNGRLLNVYDKGLRFGSDYYQTVRSTPIYEDELMKRIYPGLSSRERYKKSKEIKEYMDKIYEEANTSYEILQAFDEAKKNFNITEFDNINPEDKIALFKLYNKHGDYYYLEGRQPTMRMDDLKIITVENNVNELSRLKNSLENKGYKVIDLSNTTLDEKQKIIDENNDIKTKFILPYGERTDVVNLKFSMSRVQHNTVVENILKDFEPTTQKFESKDYNTYYIPKSINGKSVRIYEMIGSSNKLPSKTVYVENDENMLANIKRLIESGKTDIAIKLSTINNEKYFYDKIVDNDFHKYEGDDNFSSQLLDKIKNDCDVYKGKDGSLLVKEKGNPIFIAKGTNAEMLDEILKSGDEGGITFSFGISNKYPYELSEYGDVTLMLTNKDESMFNDFYYFNGDGWTIEPRHVAAFQLLEKNKKEAKEILGDNYKEASRVLKDVSLLNDKTYLNKFFDTDVATKSNLRKIKKAHPERFSKEEIEKIYNKYGLVIGKHYGTPGFKLSASGKEQYYFLDDTLTKKITKKYNNIVSTLPIKLSEYVGENKLFDIVKLVNDINRGKFDVQMAQQKGYEQFKKLDFGEQQAILAKLLDNTFQGKMTLDPNTIILEGRRARMESKYLKGIVISNHASLDQAMRSIKNNGYKYDLIDQETLYNTVKLQDRLNSLDDKTLFVIDNTNDSKKGLDNLGKVMFSKSKTLTNEQRINVLDEIVNRQGFKDTSVNYLYTMKELNRAGKNLGAIKQIPDKASLKGKNINRRGPSKQMQFVKEASSALKGRREALQNIIKEENGIKNIRNTASYKLLERISNLTKTNPSLIQDIKKSFNTPSIVETNNKNMDISNNSFGDTAPAGYLDPKYGDISSMQQWIPQVEIDLMKTYGKFEIIPYTKNSEGTIDFTKKDNFVLRSNDGYSFFKVKNQLDRLDANHIKVYEREGSNIVYYSKNRNAQDAKDTIKDGIDIFDEVSGFTSVCNI